ncbi:hypothetical protein [Nocardia shimofusensis]|uniref:hypothetical protein n=1 Tax=Nocardia shimofusensis TaxID=228596 RepID=UPI00082D1636|nr:hypothetical protein [Nocardia shimofusensis]
MDGGSRYEAYEAELWERLAVLLPSAEDAENFRDCHETGRQEAGLGFLMHRLIEHRVPVTDRTRAEIEVLAEQWGERLARHDEVVACARDSEGEVSIRLVPDDASSPVGPDRLGITDPALAGLLVVPWLECLRCRQVLDRVHAQEPWGELGYLAAYYTLRRSATSDSATEIFDEADLHSAFEKFLSCT